MRSSWRSLVLVAAFLTLLPTFAASRNYTSSSLLPQGFSTFEDRPPGCPPCFNCNLEAFQCHQFAHCNKANGKCGCTVGFGGDDCSDPLCGSPPFGRDRSPRPPGQTSCECTEGWEGINCNVCKTNDACNALMPEGEGGVCYREGALVKENHQMCDVTNRMIVERLSPKLPQVTFSCNKDSNECNFQCKMPHSSAETSH